jgi:hypothetical protein
MNYAPFYPSHVCMLIHSVVLGSIDRVSVYDYVGDGNVSCSGTINSTLYIVKEGSNFP